MVLFIDFLGFKEIVARTATDRGELDKLIEAMELLGAIGEDMHLKSQRTTQFSDSFVASYDVTETSAVFHLLNSIALCVVELAMLGYLVRGAVTVGDLLHSKRHLVGPAMVAAYEMESKIARWPRVLIDEAVLALAREYRDEKHSPQEEAEYVGHFMTLDEDGRFYFDYVSFQSVIVVTGADGDLYPRYLGRLGEMVAAGLAHVDSGVRDKYLWLHRRYVAAIGLVEGLPSGHPFREREPEDYAALISLPKHLSLASDAAAAAAGRIVLAKLPALDDLEVGSSAAERIG